MQVSPKQDVVLQTVRNRSAEKIFLIGALGTSKTYVMALALLSIAQQYPNSFIPVGRKTIAEARVGTLLSFLEVLDNQGKIEGKDYKGYGLYGGNDLKLVFPNGSIVQFVPLDQTKDRDWQRIKGINATAAGVDEVDGVQESGFDMLAARVGRKNNEVVNGYTAPAIIIAACNPNEKWTKDRVYLPYRKNRLPKGVCVIEFGITDSWLYNSGFYDRYASNPKQWRERYLNNNWDYLDDDQSLFKSRVLDNIEIPQLPQDVTSFAGQDVAREGKDRSVTARIDGNVLADIVIYDREDLERLASDKEKAAPPYSHILGRQFIKYCQANSVGYQNAAGDAVGLGAGFIDFCRSEEFYVEQFKAGSRPEPRPMSRADKRAGKKPEIDFDMLRSQIAWSMAADMESGDFFFYENCPFLSEVKQELLYHITKTTDKLMRLESKEQLKNRLGKSPDVADAVFIAYWKMKFKQVGTFDMTPTLKDDDGEAVMPGRGQTITGGLQSKSF